MLYAFTCTAGRFKSVWLARCKQQTKGSSKLIRRDLCRSDQGPSKWTAAERMARPLKRDLSYILNVRDQHSRSRRFGAPAIQPATREMTPNDADQLVLTASAAGIPGL